MSSVVSMIQTEEVLGFRHPRKSGGFVDRPDQEIRRLKVQIFINFQERQAALDQCATSRSGHILNVEVASLVRTVSQDPLNFAYDYLLVANGFVVLAVHLGTTPRAASEQESLSCTLLAMLL
jgi:hypothetical protein